VLLAAADSYEEAKLRHLAAIVPSVAVRSDVSPADGVWVSKLATRLTWRQLLVLGIFARLPERQPRLDDFDRDTAAREPLPGALALEIEELATLGWSGRSAPTWSAFSTPSVASRRECGRSTCERGG
jgi:hypothetical protein